MLYGLPSLPEVVLRVRGRYAGYAAIEVPAVNKCTAGLGRVNDQVNMQERIDLVQTLISD